MSMVYISAGFVIIYTGSHLAILRTVCRLLTQGSLMCILVCLDNIVSTLGKFLAQETTTYNHARITALLIPLMVRLFVLVSIGSISLTVCGTAAACSTEVEHARYILTLLSITYFILHDLFTMPMHSGILRLDFEIRDGHSACAMDITSLPSEFEKG